MFAAKPCRSFVLTCPLHSKILLLFDEISCPTVAINNFPRIPVFYELGTTHTSILGFERCEISSGVI